MQVIDSPSGSLMLCFLPVDRDGRRGAPIVRLLASWKVCDDGRRLWMSLDHSTDPERAALYRSRNAYQLDAIGKRESVGV